jgi:hypothetical protein
MPMRILCTDVKMEVNAELIFSRFFTINRYLEPYGKFIIPKKRNKENNSPNGHR